MFNKILKYFLISLIFYQTPLYSKSISFDDFNSKDLSVYFSGIVAFENRNNSEALKFFNSSKDLLEIHNPYLKRFVTSLVLEKKVSQAINIILKNKNKKNTNFFDAYLLLIINDLKKNNFDSAYENLNNAFKFIENDRFNSAILEILKQYIYVFKEKKIIDEKKDFGNLSFIAETFQRCYLSDPKTNNYFLNLINTNEADYSRYIFFYVSNLVQNHNFDEAKQITSDINFINSTLLLSQGKDWIENQNFKKFEKIFSCQNHNHVVSEFLFLISNLYSSQDDFVRSNFYLYLSNYLNPDFIYNLSLIAENYYFNKDYKKSLKILKNFNRDDIFYFWFRKKKEAQIIGKQKNKSELLNFITSEFNKINNPNNKMIFDLANFYKSSNDYDNAIKYYSFIIKNLNNNSSIKSDLLYRRGGSYERKGDYINADKDLLKSLEIDPDDAYVLNYLAYSWLERDYKIEKAIEMLENAYSARSNYPYIIDSLGWAYYLTDDFSKAEEYLKRAVELMPDDPIVNDHYGDILWKLDQKIQARYFWKNVLEMEDVEEDMIRKIKIKFLNGPQNS